MIHSSLLRMIVAAIVSAIVLVGVLVASGRLWASTAPAPAGTTVLDTGTGART